MTRSVISLVCTCALGLVACGGAGDDAGDVLARTAERLRDIESAVLDARFEVQPSGAAGDEPFGWRIQGPVEFAPKGLPEAEVTFTQFVGDEEGTARFLSDGERAVAEIDGTAYTLPEEQAAMLRGGAEDLGVLDLSNWVIDPEIDGGADIDGMPTDVVRADLDVAAAFEDLLSLVPEGADASAEDAAGLARATQDATIEVVSGRDDRLLRQLTIELAFSSDTSEELGGRPVAGASFLLDIALAEVNQNVEVDVPEKAPPLPLSDARSGDDLAHDSPISQVAVDSGDAIELASGSARSSSPPTRFAAAGR